MRFTFGLQRRKLCATLNSCAKRVQCSGRNIPLRIWRSPPDSWERRTRLECSDRNIFRTRRGRESLLDLTSMIVKPRQCSDRNIQANRTCAMFRLEHRQGGRRRDHHKRPASREESVGSPTVASPSLSILNLANNNRLAFWFILPLGYCAGSRCPIRSDRDLDIGMGSGSPQDRFGRDEWA